MIDKTNNANEANFLEFSSKPLPAEHNYDITYEHCDAKIVEKKLDDFDISKINVSIDFFLERLRDKSEAKMLKKMFALFVKISEKFLNQRYLFDDFDKHAGVGSRDEWHQKLATESSPLLENIKDNSLKRGSLTKVAQPLGTLVSFGVFEFNADLKNRADSLKEKTSIDFKKYDEMSVKDKIDYVQSVKRELFDFLIGLTKITTSDEQNS